MAQEEESYTFKYRDRRSELQSMSMGELNSEIVATLMKIRGQESAGVSDPEEIAEHLPATDPKDRSLSEIYRELTDEVRDLEFRLARDYEELARRVPVTDPVGLSARRTALQLTLGQFDDFNDELLDRYLSEPDMPPEFVDDIRTMYRAVFGENYMFPGERNQATEEF